MPLQCIVHNTTLKLSRQKAMVRVIVFKYRLPYCSIVFSSYNRIILTIYNTSIVYFIDRYVWCIRYIIFQHLFNTNIGSMRLHIRASDSDAIVYDMLHHKIHNYFSIELFISIYAVVLLSIM